MKMFCDHLNFLVFCVRLIVFMNCFILYSCNTRSWNDLKNTWNFVASRNNEQITPLTTTVASIPNSSIMSHYETESQEDLNVLKQNAEPRSTSFLKDIIDDVAEPRRRHRRKKKYYQKFILPLLLAYKLKFFTLIPVMIGGLVLLAGSTGLAGFFFALFAAVMGLKSTGGSGSPHYHYK